MVREFMEEWINISFILKNKMIDMLITQILVFNILCFYTQAWRPAAAANHCNIFTTTRAKEVLFFRCIKWILLRFYLYCTWFLLVVEYLVNGCDSWGKGASIKDNPNLNCSFVQRIQVHGQYVSHPRGIKMCCFDLQLKWSSWES